MRYEARVFVLGSMRRMWGPWKISLANNSTINIVDFKPLDSGKQKGVKKKNPKLFTSTHPKAFMFLFFHFYVLKFDSDSLPFFMDDLMTKFLKNGSFFELYFKPCKYRDLILKFNPV